MLYLDNNATTKLAPEVRASMEPFLGENYANPSTTYRFGSEARRAVEEAREKVAFLIGAKSAREIVFTSGGTESNATAIYSALKTEVPKKRIVTTSVEHASIMRLCETLSEDGVEVVHAPVQADGSIDLGIFEKILTSETAIASVMWGNNETGVLFPIKEISEITKENNILLHVDAVQVVGKQAVSLDGMDINYLSISAHKFHGPKGVGALYVKEGSPFHALFYGGRQERDKRAGTENVAGIIGFAKALELACEYQSSKDNIIGDLRDELERGLASDIDGSLINGAGPKRLNNTLNMTIPGVDSEALLIRLGEMNIAASSGSACMTGAIEPSHVLQAMGRTREDAMSSIRLTLSRYTTREDIRFALTSISKVITDLRAVSVTHEG